jgi:3-phenylpropionate/trans-cinnamate dioxygenase ferredoxin reductase subunit
VVVGGGQAAAQLIEVARQEGFQGHVTLVTEEPVLPYQRPPLSKQFLAGHYAADWLLYRPADFYTKHTIDVRLGRRAVEIDRARGTVRLDDDSLVAYDQLALTTGARARRLELEGDALDSVCYIRTLADVESLRPKLQASRRIVIIGGGFIGLEAAAVLVQLGHTVTLLAASAEVIPRIATRDISGFLIEAHRRHGVSILPNTTVTALNVRANERIDVVTHTGEVHTADLVIAGIGAEPTVELAQAAGLRCDNGIVVDAYARTTDPAIVAAGDCTNHPNALLGANLRLETVHNAVEQGRTAGATVAGKELPYVQVPWVWSDQYGLRIQSVGVMEGFNRTYLRGDPARGSFAIFYYRDDALLAASTINLPMAFGAVRRALNHGIPLTPEQATDPKFDLASFAKRRARLSFDVPWPTRFEKQQRSLAWGHA